MRSIEQGEPGPFLRRQIERIFTVFSRLNAGGVYLKLGLVDPAGVYSGPGVYLLNAFFSIGSFFNQEPNFNKNG